MLLASECLIMSRDEALQLLKAFSLTKLSAKEIKWLQKRGILELVQEMRSLTRPNDSE